MKASLISSFCAITLCLSGCSPKNTTWEASSPDGNITFVAQNTSTDDGNSQLGYRILYKDSLAIDFSKLGLTMNGHEYGKNAKFKGIELRSIDAPYELK